MDEIVKQAMSRDLREYIGMQVKLRRTAARMTQAELAELAGITNVQVSKLERGELNFTIDTLALIRSALALNITVDWDFGKQ